MPNDLLTAVSEQSIPLSIEELDGIPRQQEPVTCGLPFPQGVLRNTKHVGGLHVDGTAVPFQAEILDTWPDQSCKWLLLDFQATVPAHQTRCYMLSYGEENLPAFRPPESATLVTELRLEQTAQAVSINTGKATFVIDRTLFLPFAQVTIDGQPILDASRSSFEVVDGDGQRYTHRIRQIVIETKGALRITLKIEGDVAGENNPTFAAFVARLHFYANSAVAKIAYTLHNPNAAQHPGGLWDLGDAGSIYVKDVALSLALPSEPPVLVAWTTQPEQPLRLATSRTLNIYQDSSGGDQWNSPNHRNRDGKVMHSFRGYRVTSDTLLEEGYRAHPALVLQNAATRITAAIRGFWENFPNALEVQENRLIIRVFPRQAQDLFELQGGEQKTHTIYCDFTPASPLQEGTTSYSSLNWIDSPLTPHAPPKWYAQSKAFNYLAVPQDDQYAQVTALINTAIEGEKSFFQRREIIDEYGWRNFGDFYADHEAVYYKGEGTPVSHYNNQYDGLYGAILQYASSGKREWAFLLNDLAHHVIDIDIYHTTQDRPNYNGGMFWHTDHYRDAGTATHRGFSSLTMLKEGLTYYGGGPSSEHDYATGLRYHYYLTGEMASKEAVIGLANWIINMDDGSLTIFRFLNRRPTGYASTSDNPDYHGPGRGSGYSINTLLDGFLITKERRYLAKAEELVQRCIHPHDDIAQRHLDDAENRWFYIVFLQALGRFLDLKLELQELDYPYAYARASLLHYVQWMEAHETPFLHSSAKLEYPTETWAAQDLRKSNVFKFAAKYAPPELQERYRQKSTFFFESAIQDLWSFETRTLTRPLVLLMTNSPMQWYWDQYGDAEQAPQPAASHDFGMPRPFKPQLYEIRKIHAAVTRVVQTVKRILRH